MLNVRIWAVSYPGIQIWPNLSAPVMDLSMMQRGRFYVVLHRVHWNWTRWGLRKSREKFCWSLGLKMTFDRVRSLGGYDETINTNCYTRVFDIWRHCFKMEMQCWEFISFCWQATCSWSHAETRPRTKHVLPPRPKIISKWASCKLGEIKDSF